MERMLNFKASDTLEIPMSSWVCAACRKPQWGALCKTPSCRMNPDILNSIVEKHKGSAKRKMRFEDNNPWLCEGCNTRQTGELCKVCSDEGEEVESVLQEAEKLVHGARQENYDHPYDNHVRIAGFLSVFLADKLKEPITPREAAMCILLVKIAREMYRSKRDNGVDVCGYAAVIEMIDRREEEVCGESSGSWHRS